MFRPGFQSYFPRKSSWDDCGSVRRSFPDARGTSSDCVGAAVQRATLIYGAGGSAWSDVTRSVSASFLIFVRGQPDARAIFRHHEGRNGERPAVALADAPHQHLAPPYRSERTLAIQTPGSENFSRICRCLPDHSRNTDAWGKLGSCSMSGRKTSIVRATAETWAAKIFEIPFKQAHCIRYGPPRRTPAFPQPG